MTEEQQKIIFEPHGRTVYELQGSRLIEAAAAAGLTLETPCGGAGTCGKCRVRVVKNAAPPVDAEKRHFTKAELEAGWRLACQTQVARTGEMAVEIPEGSLFAGRHQIQVASDTENTADLESGIRKTRVELPVPQLGDDAPDLLRLENAGGPLHAGIEVLRELPEQLRENGFKGTLVTAGEELIGFEAGDTTDRAFAIAIDIGTTTLAGALLDMKDGAERATVSRMNPQVSWDDDVLSRITHGSTADGLKDLHTAIIDAVNGMTAELCERGGIPADSVYSIAFSGNTTMEHLFCGLSPAQLGQAPFAPAFARGLRQNASELGLRVHPRAVAFVSPVIGGFVGGDTVAGMLATRLEMLEKPALMVDIGTNGEIVLAAEDGIRAASTAAGPAFEGARITCGMRATEGAIEKVLINKKLHLGVIGNTRPAGLCGSGLIDLCAGLLDAGLVTPSGKLLPPEEVPEDTPPEIRDRVQRDGDGGVMFVLGDNSERPVALHAKDIRELQLAAGAIRAGIAILLKQAGLQLADLRHILIAGGFGSFIRRNHAQRIGLLPPEAESHRIRYVGNASLSGAKWMALSARAREEAERLARHTRHVELSRDTEFAMEFAMAMQFPEKTAVAEA
jgi:uncharacterized 2Fe-2S/4Fe-4S cluster protein (DUF4445 family)